MRIIVSQDVVISLEKKLPQGGKGILANRLGISGSAVYMKFQGKRKLYKHEFDEACKIIDEHNKLIVKCNKVLKHK